MANNSPYSLINIVNPVKVSNHNLPPLHPTKWRRSLSLATALLGCLMQSRNVFKLNVLLLILIVNSGIILPLHLTWVVRIFSNGGRYVKSSLVMNDNLIGGAGSSSPIPHPCADCPRLPCHSSIICGFRMGLLEHVPYWHRLL
jgi:hypothetical protein